jgi:hypothetical protein
VFFKKELTVIGRWDRDASSGRKRRESLNEWYI